MDSPSPRSRWLFVQGAAGLALLALFALFFFVWVPERRARLTERHFRLLAESGDQIRSAIGTLYTSLTNAASAAVGARLGELTGVVGVDDVERALEAVVPALHIVRRPELEPTTDRFRQVTLGLRRDLKHRWLHFDYVEAAPVGNSTNGNSPGTLRFAVQTDLGRLIEPTVVHHGFDDVLLTSEDGAVMYQSSGGALRVTRLPVSSEAVAGSAVRGADTNYLVTAATLGEIRVAGTDYHLFAQPLHFSLPYATGPTNAVFQWVIAGLVKSRTFRAQTMTVPNTAIILLIFAVALVLLSWPFFNVVLAGPRDELRSSHAFGAAASSFLACGALMLLLLDWAGHSRFGDRMDADLRSFAETLTTNLSRELDAVNRQLIEFDQHVANAPALRLNRTNVLAGQMAPYPFLRMAVWVSGAGQQLFKWATGPGVTPFVPVGDRAYFRAIVEDRAWPRGLARQPGAIAVTNRFFLEPIYSRTRGENVAVFSLASRAGAPSNATPAAVVYGEFRPLSLMGAVVPAGFGFCVVDESGRALFHSDERRNLQENFVEECEGHPRLRAAMSARTTDEFDARYFRRPHRLRVAPLPGFPWTLVAFRDERPVDTARLEMLSTAAILFALYGLLMLGGLSVAFLRHRRGAPVWLWPDRERTPAYRWVMVANLVITVLFGVGLLVFTSPAMRLAQALLLPIIAVCFAYRVLKSDHWRKDPWQWFENRRAKLAQRVDRLRQETSVRLGGAPDETSFSRQRPVRALATLGRVVERFPWP
ncbi:MAG TPA: cache domain-containing protein, partial [Methylomirabilota bacterium]|nr:cache domain-containing protein [Methylomirabilota bacterium]